MVTKTETVEEFLARGGEIQQIENNEATINYMLLKCRCGCKGNTTKHEQNETAMAMGILDCECGCEGNYTDHQMRKAEKGDFSR